MKVQIQYTYIPCEIWGSYSGEESRGSSDSIVPDYRLDDRGSIPVRGRGFFF
jgi:hypothetical protein